MFSGRKHGWEKGEGVLESALHGAPWLSPWDAAPIPHKGLAAFGGDSSGSSSHHEPMECPVQDP